MSMTDESALITSLINQLDDIKSKLIRMDIATDSQNLIEEIMSKLDALISYNPNTTTKIKLNRFTSLKSDVYTQLGELYNLISYEVNEKSVKLMLLNLIRSVINSYSPLLS